MSKRFSFSAPASVHAAPVALALALPRALMASGCRFGSLRFACSTSASSAALFCLGRSVTFDVSLPLIERGPRAAGHSSATAGSFS